MIKKILTPILFLILTSCQENQTRNNSEFEVIGGVVYKVKFDTLIVISCERHKPVSVMDEINPGFDVTFDNGRTMRTRRSIPIGDTIYTKTIKQWQ
jgi:hypothetical protein